VVEVPDAAVIPRAARWAALAWLAVWLPLHLVAYPPWTLLWWCAHGAVIAAAGLFLGSRLLVSWQAVALVVPQTLYAADALARLVTGIRGGGTSYLFDASVPGPVRALSTFHFFMPFVLVWAVRRLGYDRRALALQIVAGTAVAVASLPFGAINAWIVPAARDHVAATLVLSPIALWWPADAILRRLGRARTPA
jgi:hypothetical protein